MQIKNGKARFRCFFDVDQGNRDRFYAIDDATKNLTPTAYVPNHQQPLTACENPQRPLSLGGGNRSSCFVPAIAAVRIIWLTCFN
jgi:hypothetical protein